ncbi:Clavaminate synthase-like protein [Lactifluus subvellereus]|nr:Clavaminate synthase-like protein [Lactifluus subvellereus]
MTALRLSRLRYPSLARHRYPYPVTATQEGLEIPPLSATFSYRWLRDACTCPSCIHPSTQQKLHRSSDIPASIAPEGIETTPDGVYIFWAGPNRHRSFFSQALLATHANSAALHGFHNDVPATLWPTASALLDASDGDLEVSYDDISTPRGLLRAITQLQRTGLLFLRGVPHADTSHATCEVRRVAARFAELRETFYGAVWDVTNAVDSCNIAYTNLFLGLHMDLLYFESPPRFQILHCIRNRVHGGASLFVDAFAAAAALRAAHPEDFAQLTTTPIPFQYINGDRHLHHAHPTIALGPSTGSDSGAPDPRITAAPFPRDMPPAFYDALARFAAIAEAPAAVYTHQLNEGDAVIFDNRRLLHGRTAFEDRSGEEGGKPNRWLKGCYFEADTMASHGRVLRARAARGEI